MLVFIIILACITHLVMTILVGKYWIWVDPDFWTRSYQKDRVVDAGSLFFLCFIGWPVIWLGVFVNHWWGGTLKSPWQKKEK